MVRARSSVHLYKLVCTLTNKAMVGPPLCATHYTNYPPETRVSSLAVRQGSSWVEVA